MNEPTAASVAGARTLFILSALIASACFAQAPSSAPPGTRESPGGSPGAPGRSSEVNGPPAVAPAKLQNFVGVWSILRSAKTTPVPPKGAIPFTPAYEAKRAELERMDNSGEVIKGRNALCKPAGMPDMMTFGFVVSATAEYMTVLGGYGTFRPVYLNRKTHTAAKILFPTYQGENLGHFEGDTLVIDSVGYDPENEITYALPVGDPDMHIVERWKLLNKNELEVVITIESPLALTKPYTFTMVYARRPSSELVSAVTYCDQPLVNDSLDLTPPSGGYIPPNAK